MDKDELVNALQGRVRGRLVACYGISSKEVKIIDGAISALTAPAAQADAEPVAIYDGDTSHLPELQDQEMAKNWRWMRKDFKRGDKLYTTTQSGVREGLLLDGMRFKMSFNSAGNVSCFSNYRDQLDGQWVALIDATDGKHIRAEAEKLPQSHETPELLIKGVSKEQARIIVDEMWGSCHWAYNKCYPAEGVTVQYTPAMLRAAQEGK